MKQDIFDRIMQLPLFHIFEPFYKKNKEVLLYLFFGGLTFLVSVITYALFNVSMGINELVANVFSWTIAVLFAFFTNRTWVFDAETTGSFAFFRQMAGFLGGRLVTLGVEEVILLVFISFLHFPSMCIKVIAQIVIIVLNYIISKLFVFNTNSKCASVDP